MSIPRPKKGGATDPKDRIEIPCGKCAYCLQRKRNEWFVRLKTEQKYSDYTYFITLTYNDENINYGKNSCVLHKPDIQNFFKRLRKKCKVRYFAIGEYGTSTFRPHYHSILFTDENSTSITKYIASAWTLGNFDIKLVEDAMLNYVTKHQLYNYDKNKFEVQPFRLISSRPYIGYKFIEKYKDYYDEIKLTAKVEGITYNLPRIYRNKLYNEQTLREFNERRNSQAPSAQDVSNFNEKLKDDNYFKRLVEDYDQYKASLIKRSKKHTNQTI